MGGSACAVPLDVISSVPAADVEVIEPFGYGARVMFVRRQVILGEAKKKILLRQYSMPGEIYGLR
jgi:hypothetical protein